MLAENRITFKSGNLTIEGLFSLEAGRSGAVLAHPHPMMGGNMRDHVLMSMVLAFQEKGYSTLRFNFRGIGRSEGSFDGIRGEQDDARAAVSFIRSMGKDLVVLAGYSFGAWVCSKIAKVEDPASIALVSPPLTEMKFDFRAIKGKSGLIIFGDLDHFCPPTLAKKAAKESGFDMSVIAGADHFYFGHTQSLTEVLGKRLSALMKHRAFQP